MSDGGNFRIFGNDMQFIEVDVMPSRTVISEAGAMMYMSDGIKMEASLSKGLSGGILRKAATKLLTGESLFTVSYTNETMEPKVVAFVLSYPGQIIPIDLSNFSGGIVCQKGAFLCALDKVKMGVAFQKKFRAGLFGGEGFILQRIEGKGYVFLGVGGSVKEISLASGEVLQVDTGCLAAMEGSVKYDVKFVKGIKTMLFGGEGVFLATLKGPGRVFIQSMPFSRLLSIIDSRCRRS